jgi:hypothetical protein
MHTAKKEKEKRKPCQTDQRSGRNYHHQKQHLDCKKVLQNDASNKGTMHKHHRRLIIDQRFSPEESPTKLQTMPSIRRPVKIHHCHVQPMKVRHRVFILEI